MKFDKIEQMQRSWDRFWNSFLRILTKIVRNVFRILYSRWIQILCSVIYYLAVIISAFLLTRDRQEDSFIKTEMKVSQLEKNLVEALIVILFFCIQTAHSSPVSTRKMHFTDTHNTIPLNRSKTKPHCKGVFTPLIKFNV